MAALVEVILPIFFVLGFGYAARWRKLISDEQVSGLMRFTQGFALPCLLFRAISTLDLAQDFHMGLLVSFYAGAILCFITALTAARLIFGRPWEDSVAIGFVGLFSNSLLLGLPITERAYGPGALAGNYSIISIHSPLCYGIGITVMEVVRHRGKGLGFLATARRVLKAMFSNALVLGITPASS